MVTVTVENRLRQLAFGDVPHPDTRSRHRIVAAARTDRECWLAAVALGARGHYAAAATLLQPLIHGAGAGAGSGGAVLSSLAASTLASHRRQLGGHAAALRLDGLALARITASPDRPEPGLAGPMAQDADGVDAAGAWADALLGLAADRLGTGRPDLAGGLVARVLSGTGSRGGSGDTGASDRSGDRAGTECAAGVEPAVLSWRSRVRAGWVGAEAALAGGDPQTAVGRAEAALAVLAEPVDPAVPAHAADPAAAAAPAGTADLNGPADPGALGPRVPRHRAKSELVLAAALAARGGGQDRVRAGELVDSALEVIETRGLRSLSWPALLLAADLAQGGRGAQHRARATREVHALLRSADPEARRLAVSSPWMPI